MIATLQFDLQKERQAFDLASRADKLALTLIDMDERLRYIQKHLTTSKEVVDVIDGIRSTLFEFLCTT